MTKENMFKGSKVMCDGCPNENKECCERLWDKISCFVQYLYESNAIYISNGSEGMAIEESIFNILRRNSEDKRDSEGEDVKVIKPSDVLAEILPKYLEEKSQTTL